MLLNLSVIFQTSVPLQVQLCACCSAGILHGALCPFQRVSGSIWGRSPWNSSPRAQPGAAMRVSQQFLHLSGTGRAEPKFNSPSGISAGANKGKSTARFHPGCTEQGAPTTAWNVKDLKFCYRIYSTFLLYLSWKEMLHQIYHFCPQKIGKLLIWVFLQH